MSKSNKEKLDERRQFEITQEVSNLCCELGWQIALPHDDDGSVGRGLIIGDVKFLHGVLSGSAFEGGRQFEILAHDTEGASIDEVADQIEQLEFDRAIIDTADDKGKVH